VLPGRSRVRPAQEQGQGPGPSALTEIWRHPIHTREFGSQVTNVLRCLQLEAHGYQVTVTELVGWEHSMKNELIVATYKNLPRKRPASACRKCCPRWAWKKWASASTPQAGGS
jgi:hypothetical protein